ncbi:folate family ECF transporter S component [Geosporobacter ferrireducens]|uniref:Folate transporter n=1 Tax=Geosporobacter ferrireducens TaxID=1424294 RepID=A0A1D8GKQ2_9FIRM|nr:folate family ECF transporter S component [Geosporobacter ferrireducens]AOT71490.1 folate transporter [Geosporobacter ferrireducens]MTI57800.1 folate family ECF transporter S component [Geosporobacter ferrireducens]
MRNTRKLVFLALFIALEVVLTRFLSIQTPIVRIGFTFLPIALSSMMFGPWFGGIAAALADILGMMIFPAGGAYFPGFTLTAFLTGSIYGIFLYRKPKNLLRISMAVIVISVIINLGLDTLWLWMITGKAIMVLLPARVIKCLIMIPIQIPMIHVVWHYTLGRLNFNYSTSGINS